jgi:hypothetical protein
MRSWDERPPEVAYLLNPSFCGCVLFRCAQRYAIEGERKPMPYSLTFLVLPLVLHPATRDTMKGSIRHFQVWLNENQHIRIGLAGRARSLVPYTREALAFLQQTGVIAVHEADAGLVILGGLRSHYRRRFPIGEDTRSCLKKAEVLGKWFARVNSPATIYASLGLMP